MDRLSNTNSSYNLQMNQPSFQSQLNISKEEKEINPNSLEIKEDLLGETIEKNLYKGRQSKTGLCKSCGCSIKSKILSCSICHISRCKVCVEKESNVKSTQKKGIKKLFYICKSCMTEQEGKMRKHDMTIHYKKEPTEFLQKKHKINETPQNDNDNSDEDSCSEAKKKKSLMTIKKKKNKIFPEKIYNLIEKQSVNYFSANKEEMCIECNNKCSNDDKVKPFASIEQLLYYFQYYYEEVQLFNNEEYNSNKIDYTSIISNAIVKEKGQHIFNAKCNFIVCQNCMEFFQKYDSLEFTSFLDQLLQKVHLLYQKKVLEDNIFSAPGIYSKLSLIITQFLIVQGFSNYQKQFIQCLFSKIKESIEKIATNEYSNSALLKLILSSNSVNEHNIQNLKHNHLRSNESIKNLDELFSKFQDGSKEIFTSVSLKNNDLDQIIKMLNNCFSVLGQTNDGISTKNANNLISSQKFIESLINKFKNIVSNNLGESESKEQGNAFLFDTNNKSATNQDDIFTQESWPFSLKINELYPLMFTPTQGSTMSNNTLELLLKSNEMNNASKINNKNNLNSSNNSYFDFSCERPQIQNQIGNVNLLFNNLPTFTLSLNNYSNNSTSDNNNFNQQFLQLSSNINPQNQFYPSQTYLQHQQQMNNLNQYQQSFPINPFN